MDKQAVSTEALELLSVILKNRYIQTETPFERWIRLTGRRMYENWPYSTDDGRIHELVSKGLVQVTGEWWCYVISVSTEGYKVLQEAGLW